MVIKLTRWNRFEHLTQEMEDTINENLLAGSVGSQIQGAAVGEHVMGGTYFPEIEDRSGKKVSALVEFNYKKVSETEYMGGIVSMLMSDEEMPDEFLDRMNYWRDRFKDDDCTGTNPDNFKMMGGDKE